MEGLEGKTGGRETGSAVAVTGFESMLTWTKIEAMPTGRSADLGTTWERRWVGCRAGWIWVGREKEQSGRDCSFRPKQQVDVGPLTLEAGTAIIIS